VGYTKQKVFDLVRLSDITNHAGIVIFSLPSEHDWITKMVICFKLQFTSEYKILLGMVAVHNLLSVTWIFLEHELLKSNAFLNIDLTWNVHA